MSTEALPVTSRPLSADDVERYRRDGYLLLPPAFMAGPVLDRAAATVPAALAEPGPRRVLERDGSTVRSVYGVHQHVPAVRRLAADRRLLDAARAAVDDEVYVHQSKVNVKASFAGDQWEWHQDYIYWWQNDGIVAPDLVNVAVYLDEVTQHNGPLTFVPGSHRDGVLAADESVGMPEGYETAPTYVSTLTASEKFRVSTGTVSELAGRHGLVSPTGPAGSVLLFHPNLLHASAANISPFRRSLLLFVYNAVGNAPAGGSPRPDFLADPDHTPWRAA